MSYIHTDGVEYSDDKKTLVSCPEEATEITILDSVTSIGEDAFFCCSGLTSIVIPEGVTSIGEWAFLGCSGLTSIVIPDSVTSIGERAFWGCSGLKELRIPKGTRDKFCAMPELKEYENLLVEYKKEEKEKCAIPESE
ncbi:MAG: leucine-rich repeat domain-containing protein [Paludibacteraceae bacterium]|nr:leucine-rich repeat domain-containing protein [Paludibacteraceae bacterium]